MKWTGGLNTIENVLEKVSFPRLLLFCYTFFDKTGNLGGTMFF